MKSGTNFQPPEISTYDKSSIGTGGGRKHSRRTTGKLPSSAGELTISRLILDPHNTFGQDCEPFTEIPAWWSGFIFHVLNARQISLYLYLCMLLDAEGTCAPTVEQIRQDLDLSGSIVFGALRALTDYGFILRQRRYIASLRSRRNVYQRPSCEFTILRVMQLHKIDGDLRAVPGPAHQMSDDSAKLKQEWLRSILEDRYEKYVTASDKAKVDILSAALQRVLTRPDS